MEKEKKPKKEVSAVVYDTKKTYYFVSNGKAKLMPEGETFKISGDLANYFTKKGLGSVTTESK